MMRRFLLSALFISGFFAYGFSQSIVQYHSSSYWSYSGSGVSGSSFTGNSTNHNHNSAGYIKFQVLNAGTIYIYSSVSSESGYDYAHVYVDGSQVWYQSGVYGWGWNAYYVSPGEIIEFRYTKDGSVSSGNDEQTFQLYSNNPQINYISPSSGDQGQTLSVSISGSNMNYGSQWSGTLSDFRFSQWSGSNMFYGNPTNTSGNYLYGDVSIPNGQNTGWYDLEVYDQNTSNWIQKSNAFEVLAVTTYGCTDPIAYNYDSLVLFDDGSCCYVSGCIDPIANNYDPSACFDDGSCTYNYGCTDIAAANYDPTATMDDGSCIYCNQNVVDTLNYTGAMQTYTVPAGVTSVTIEAYGAQGGTNEAGVYGGQGGFAMGDLVVSPGQVLELYVGGSNGWGGGGLEGTTQACGTSCDSSQGGTGGGASDVRVFGNSLSDRVIVAGGGGGAGGNRIYNGSRGSGGGGGGGYYGGGGGGAGYAGITSGDGGTQTSGGNGGTGNIGNGGFGVLGYGGAGGDESGYGQVGNATGPSGGVGGGYSGGVGGVGPNYTGAGGGGGSSYIGGVTNGSTNSGLNTGNGLVIISYSTQTCTGCTDSLALNYDSLVLFDDGSCCYVSGCIDPIANNYDPSACFDDGSCTYNYGCTDIAAANYDPTATMDDGSCIYCNQNAVDTFNYTGAMQTYIVPAGVTSVTIEAFGAQGGAGSLGTGGLGAYMKGDFNVTPGDILNVITGGAGGSGVHTAGGGGGSFVWDALSNSLFIASGGGGGGGQTDAGGVNYDGIDAVITNNGTNGNGVSNGGGSSGSGGSIPTGTTGDYASGGAGWFSNGNNGSYHGCTYNSTGGTTPLLGGNGGTGGGEWSYTAGFGGGGGGNARCGAVGGGGGGGYSGGGAGAEIIGGDYNGGGGGGSYNMGTNQNNTAGVQYGNGLVIISSTQTCTGCTDSLAFNYDSLALYDDGSCIICDISTSLTVMNATVPGSCDGFAFINASSSYSSIDFTWYDNSNTIIASGVNFVSNLCYGAYYVESYDSVGCLAVDTVIIGDLYGCTDPIAYNYDPLANTDDGSCVPVVYGCTDSTMFNYNSLANTDDGSCIPFIYGCMDSIAYYYDPLANTDDGSCCYVAGCTDPAMFNYNAAACYEDSGCVAFIYGCNDPGAYNYDPSANTDDGSCQYCDLSISLIVTQESSPSACDGWVFVNANSSNTPITYYWSTGIAVNNIVNLCTGAYSVTVTDAVGCTLDTTIIIGNPVINGCTDPLATNYDPLATTDDGSCIYLTCNEDAPTGLFTSNVIHNRATINWDNMNSALCFVDQYRIQYREVGASSWSQKTMSGPVGSCNFASQKTDKLILNLTANTNYEYQMKAWYCGAGASSWSGIETFTTLDNCPNVGNLAVYGATPTKATFTWDASNGVYSFVRLKARIDSISNPTGADFFQIGGAGVAYGTWTKNKNGLTPGETYRGQARTYCDPNGGAWKSLSWTPLVYWTQPTLRIEGGEAISHLAIYPNPSKDVFNISFTSERVQDLRVRVLNVVGEEIVKESLQQYIGEYTKQINLEDNAKGIYFLEIETENGIINKKLVLQ